MSKRKKYIIWFSVLGLIIFIGTYLGYTQYNKNLKTKKKIYEDSSSVMSESEHKDVVKNNTKLVFKTLYLKSNETVEEEKTVQEYDKEIIGYNKEKLQQYFYSKNFKIESMNSNKVVLMKEMDRYSPNKYVIGIEKTEKGEYMAIFKTDSEGKMYIESKDDISNMTIDMLRKEEVKMLKEGSIDFQFDTKDKAKEGITEYQS